MHTHPIRHIARSRAVNAQGRACGSCIRCQHAVPDRGFTLVELMVTVTVLCVMMAVAAPSLQTFVQGVQLRAATNDIAAALAYARSESVKRGIPVSVCKSVNVHSASATCSTNTNDSWESGWLVFADVNGNGVLETTTTPSDTLLRVGSTRASRLTVASTAFPDVLTYRPDGTTGAGTGTAPWQFTVNLANQTRLICIGNTGRAQVEKAACSS